MLETCSACFFSWNFHAQLDTNVSSCVCPFIRLTDAKLLQLTGLWAKFFYHGLIRTDSLHRSKQAKVLKIVPMCKWGKARCSQMNTLHCFERFRGCGATCHMGRCIQERFPQSRPQATLRVKTVCTLCYCSSQFFDSLNISTCQWWLPNFQQNQTPMRRWPIGHEAAGQRYTSRIRCFGKTSDSELRHSQLLDCKTHHTCIMPLTCFVFVVSGLYYMYSSSENNNVTNNHNNNKNFPLRLPIGLVATPCSKPNNNNNNSI